ncbi:MAG: RNA-directed DNA polymerase [Gammaproteobacteria bacterium]|nr:RNA-directed DNA polymerase [Gammaproteobacteria bacterium]
MALDFTSALKRSLRNTIAHGDTDVFPFPFEKNLFADKPDECIALLNGWHKDFQKSVATNPPSTVSALCQVGYSGFRQVTQIDPFWNAYYLALVIQIAQEIENLRLSTDDNKVFSYRFLNGSSDSLFHKLTWFDYRTRAVELAECHEYVVLTDISDFYPRVNHHRLDNALARLPKATSISHEILCLLSNFSHRQSYGLPVGGPASRLLSELALVDVDRSLRSAGVDFCRYADDYTLFCSSHSHALKTLVDLTQALALEGLSLQKQKTKVMHKTEFIQMNAHLDPKPSGTMEQKLLGLSLKYDPYSPTAEEDYVALKAAVADIDIVGILMNEVAKTTINQTLMRQALSALRALELDKKELALSVILAPENTHVLSPVFPQVMRMVRGIYDELNDAGKETVDENLLSLVEESSHVLSVEINRLFLVQLLSRRQSDEKERALIALYNQHENQVLRRMIIHALANWDCGYFVKGELEKFSNVSPWMRRAMIVSSYPLEDYGKYWRLQKKNTFNEVETLLRDWASERKLNGRAIPV